MGNLLRDVLYDLGVRSVFWCKNLSFLSLMAWCLPEGDAGLVFYENLLRFHLRRSKGSWLEKHVRGVEALLLRLS